MSGNDPIQDDITLTWDADYLHRFYRHPSDPAIPAGTTAEIVILEDQENDPQQIVATWTANEITPEYVEFWVQAPATNAIEADLFYRLYLHMPPIGGEQIDHCWYRGTIRRSQ